MKSPSPQYREVPENEDLTMKLAAIVDIETPLHGLIYGKDQTFMYFIKRFEREGQRGKLSTEDFAQLMGCKTDAKYRSSMEKVVSLIDDYCIFPVLEKAKLFNQRKKWHFH